MNAQELAAVQNLSAAYSGGQMPWLPGVDFSGAAGFADEANAGINYSIVLTNTGAAAVDRLIAICPGYLTLAADVKDANGNAVAAILSEGDEVVGTILATNNLTCHGQPKSFNEFLGFLKYNPTRFTGLKMKVDDANQFDEEIYVKQMSPFRNLTDMHIYPANFKNSTQLDDKRVEIPLENFQMDSNTIVITKIQAGRTVTFTFFAGAIKNQAYELAVNAQLAKGYARSFQK